MKLSELLGDTINNKILDFFLINYPLDFSVPFISKQTKISSARVYKTIDFFMQSGILKETRRMSSQLYGLNETNKKGQIILKIKEILQNG